MLLVDQCSRAWTAVLRARPTEARLRLLPRASAVVIGLVLAVVTISAALTSARLARVERVEYPALRDMRRLRELFAATRAALGGGAASDLARADSLAEQFHGLAADARLRAADGTVMRVSDEKFGDYYDSARRAAQHANGDGASASDAGLALVRSRVLQQQLDAGVAEAGHVVDATIAGTRRLQIAAVAAVVSIAGVALLFMIALGSALAHSVSSQMEEASELALALADGNLEVEIPASTDASVGALHDALARLAAMLRDQATVAESLAAGDCRAVAVTRVPAGRTGAALAGVAGYLRAIATDARRIVDGDFTVSSEPRSSRDLVGQAHAAMLVRVTGLLEEIESATQEMSRSAEEMKGMATGLAGDAVRGAEGARSTAASLAAMTQDARGAAARTQSMEGRAADTAAAVAEGTAVLHESIEALRGVVREAAVVQSLAGEAGLLALNASIEAARAGTQGRGFSVVADEVRTLAEQASAAAREINAVSAAGAASATRSTEILGRLGPSMDDNAALVRELTSAARRHASELLALEEALGEVNQTARHGAATAEQLAGTASSLSAQARRLGALLRSNRRRDGVGADAAPVAATPLTLHRAPVKVARRSTRLAAV